MFAFVVSGVTAAAPGRVFLLPAPVLPWLAPALILAGLGAQLAALALLRGAGRRATLRRRVGCSAGALLVMAGAALDRDLTVAVGQALALMGLWLAWRPL